MSDFVVKARKKKEYQSITCRIEEDLLEEVREIVKKEKINSVGDFIIQCIQYSLENLSEMEEKYEKWIERRNFSIYFPFEE